KTKLRISTHTHTHTNTHAHAHTHTHTHPAAAVAGVLQSMCAVWRWLYGITAPVRIEPANLQAKHDVISGEQAEQAGRAGRSGTSSSTMMDGAEAAVVPSRGAPPAPRHHI